MGSVEKRIDAGGAGRVHTLPASAALRRGAAYGSERSVKASPHGSERSAKYHTVILSKREAPTHPVILSEREAPTPTVILSPLRGRRISGFTKKGLAMCYCCTLCNKCGRADKMNAMLGKRECPRCKVIVNDNEIATCPMCGSPLPPPFPELPTGKPKAKHT